MSWVKRNGEEKRLPAVNLTNDQLFFVGFAQVEHYCKLSISVKKCFFSHTKPDDAVVLQNRMFFVFILWLVY